MIIFILSPEVVKSCVLAGLKSGGRQSEAMILGQRRAQIRRGTGITTGYHSQNGTLEVIAGH